MTEGRSHLLSGGSVRLTCDVPEDPYHWTFDWFFNGQKLASGKSYAIRKARVFQSGNYTCMGTKESELDQTGILRTEISAPLPVDINGKVCARCLKSAKFPQSYQHSITNQVHLNYILLVFCIVGLILLP